MTDLYDPCLNSTKLAVNMHPDWFTHPDSEAEMTFQKAILGIGVGVVVICLAVWLKYKRRCEQTRIRPTVLIMLTCLASLFDDIVGTASNFTAWQGLPCWLSLAFTSLIVPLLGGSCIIRVLLFLFYSRFSRTAAQRMAISATDDEQEEREFQSRSRLIQNRFVLWIAFKAVLAEDDSEEVARLTAWERYQNLVALKFVTSNLGTLTIVLLLLLPIFILIVAEAVADPVFIRGCEGCAPGTLYQRMLIGMTIVVILIAVGLAYKARVYKDTWGLGRENALTVLGAVVAFIGLILNQFLALRGGTFTTQLILSGGFWICVISQTLVQLWIARAREMKMRKLGGRLPGISGIRSLMDETRGVSGSHPDVSEPVSIIACDWHYATITGYKNMIIFKFFLEVAKTDTDVDRRQASARSVGTPGVGPRVGGVVGVQKTVAPETAEDVNQPGDNLPLEKVLKNERLSKLFEQHLIDEFAVEGLLFLKDTREWIRAFSDVSENTRRARAKRIYNNYLKANALYQINVSYYVYKGVETALAKEGVDVAVTLFDDAILEIKTLLKRGALMRFFHSDLYLSTVSGNMEPGASSTRVVSAVEYTV